MGILDRLELFLRRLNVHLRLIVAFTLVLALVTGVMGIYATVVMQQKVIEAAREKLATDLALGWEILDFYYPGDWAIRNGVLYKGDTIIEGDYRAVDRIGKLTGDTVTIFKEDTRVSTNVMKGNERMVGTQVSEKVREEVLEKEKPYTGLADVVGTQNETAYQPIRDKNGKVIGIWYVGVPRTPYDNMVDHFRISMIVYSIVGILLGFLAAFLIAYSVSRPLRRIQGAVAVTSEGDLSQKIPTRANDEPGRLARMVNAMIERISELICKTNDIIHNVSESSSQLLSRSELSASNMKAMENRAVEMKQGAALQADLTGRSKAAVGEMTVAIQQLAGNAQEVSTSASQATTRAEEGSRQVEKAVKQMTVISQTVNSTAHIVEGLSVKSQEIGQIVDLITNIATQTNLLALNAAIEAARAGDQGRGFAVVADEVRKLAEESASATKRISELIVEIQGESEKAVTAMEAGTREVSNGTEVVAVAGEAFQHIIQAISAVYEQIQEISAASEEMAASAETALDSIIQTTEAAEANSLAADSISGLVDEQMEGVQEINQAVDGLNNIVQDLQEAISFFKINGNKA